MKKFFTLIACALVAGSAFAQGEEAYKDLGDVITNGGIKRTSTADDLTSFASGEWVANAETGEVEKVQGTPRVVVDPTTGYTEEDAPRSANRCIAVQTRVLEEGASADPWDSRFYITLPIDLAAGDKVTFSMKVMAKEATTISAQGHTTNDGNGYKVYRMQNDFCNNVAVSADEWTTYSVAEFEWPAADEGVNTFAFDLGGGGNEFYFDDISCTVQQKYVKELVWKEIFASDGTDATPFSVKYFRNYTDAAKVVDGAIVVTSLDPEKDYTGTYYYSDDADTEEQPAVLGRDWDTQFLIPLGTNLVGGKKFKITFKYKADKAATANSQAHKAAPAPGFIEGANHSGEGTYIHYQLLGDLNFTEEWQTYNEDLSTVISVPTQATEEKQMGAVCLNLDVLREVNNYYFDDIKVYVDEDDIPTGISAFKAEKSSKAIYNVAGQQLKSLQKGLNIVNGEKVYVK